MKPKKGSPAQDRSTPANHRQEKQNQVQTANCGPDHSNQGEPVSQSWVGDKSTPPRSNPKAWIASGIFMIGWLAYLGYVALF